LASPTYFMQGITEHTIDRHSIWAKESTDNTLLLNHTKATGTELTLEEKFCQDVCIPPSASPIPVKRSDIPNIRQIAVPLKDVEFTIVLPIGLQQIMLKEVNGGAFRVSTIAGGADLADTTHFSLPVDMSLHWDNLNLQAARTLFCETVDDTRIIEIWEWT